ncbi:NAD(P)-dependent oxidoreductase [Bacteroidales bacterium OttesenSCG-928-B11]|nr:NAD(P)-dependent oxidoreductase [Bacteroidales bacterium OttesenSCG-928-E04]MDL2312545.1 NAD(P)-dependent oxidoreductase [Bacteroidales bacterium OttesenSCG-928-B11]MDL2326502.1 NAD(P)-dependent oxidoreductase [Bacteroidales bacterium OttesenSCG-928-A14]
MKKIFITGATGFLGSHIVDALLLEGYTIYATRRAASDLSRCDLFFDKIRWVDIDKETWADSIGEIVPDVIIHSMWIGVDAGNRSDWSQQIKNIELTEKLLEVAAKVKIGKFIGLGSQAEYGNFSCKIKEDALTMPDSAYGVVKKMCSDMTRIICEENNVKWFWLRLFPLFGEKESEKWLIPSVIKSIMTKDSMDFTLGEQKYAYLYVKDFAQAIVDVVKTDGSSGVYNLSSSNPMPLREVITKIRDLINPSFQLNFGKLPYRQGQSMHIEGDVSNFENSISKIPSSDFDEKLRQTIDYYKAIYDEK